MKYDKNKFIQDEAQKWLDDENFKGQWKFGNEDQKRHKVSIDTYSLLEDDLLGMSEEDIYAEQQTFFEIIKTFPSEREKFIAVCLYFGYNKQEIAFMLTIHPSRVTRNLQELQKRLEQTISSSNARK